MLKCSFVFDWYLYLHLPLKYPGAPWIPLAILPHAISLGMLIMSQVKQLSSNFPAISWNKGDNALCSLWCSTSSLRRMRTASKGRESKVKRAIWARAPTSPRMPLANSEALSPRHSDIHKCSRSMGVASNAWVLLSFLLKCSVLCSLSLCLGGRLPDFFFSKYLSYPASFSSGFSERTRKSNTYFVKYFSVSFWYQILSLFHPQIFH